MLYDIKSKFNYLIFKSMKKLKIYETRYEPIIYNDFSSNSIS